MPRSKRDDETAGARIDVPEECVGYEVLDPLGQSIGRVEKIFVNGNGEPEYVRVRIGRFVRKSALLPVQLVTLDRAHRTFTLG